MKIISHRGFWKQINEKNTVSAFNRSLSYGFGIETDIRDYKGELVISHDIAQNNLQGLNSFFDLYKKMGHDEWLAINIKADGLRLKLLELLKNYSIKNYFVFDMSIPETLLYLKENFIVFTRHSEYEITPAFYEEADGIWMDCFNSDWFIAEDILKHLDNKKRVCLVSPELHKRDYNNVWQMLKNNFLHENENLMICTDFPDKARVFFND